MTSHTTTIVVPCYNEAERILLVTFAEFMQQNPEIQFLFVNDGSSDDTLAVLKSFCQDHAAAEVLHFDENQGKGEAVRQGMLHALKDSKVEYVGYWDADLATPLEAIPQFLDIADKNPNLKMLVGSRVKLMGRDIKRKLLRHYVGRIFATLASMILGLAVYDTQCGAKLFRNDARIDELFKDRFVSRWVFDVEIFSRLKQTYSDEPSEAIVFECPLWKWEDVAGSKLKITDFFAACRDLGLIWLKYRH